MEGMGLIFIPVLVRLLLGPPGLSRPMISSSWTLATPNSPIGRYNLPLVSHPLLPLPPPPGRPLLIHATCDITVVVKKLLKIQQC